MTVTIEVKTNEDTAYCPVMVGMPINKEEARTNGWVRDYKGKKYYLCCVGCQESFDASPETYAI